MDDIDDIDDMKAKGKPGKRIRSCNYCGYVSAYTSNYYRHLRTVHKMTVLPIGQVVL